MAVLVASSGLRGQRLGVGTPAFLPLVGLGASVASPHLSPRSTGTLEPCGWVVAGEWQEFSSVKFPVEWRDIRCHRCCSNGRGWVEC